MAIEVTTQEPDHVHVALGTDTARLLSTTTKIAAHEQRLTALGAEVRPLPALSDRRGEV